MSAHTPGPWIVEDDSRRRNAGTSMIMVVAEKGGMPGILVNQGPVEPRDRANARLVAAAPDLLAALEAFVRALNSLPRTKQAEDWMAEHGLLSAHHAARTAIKQAKGRA